MTPNQAARLRPGDYVTFTFRDARPMSGRVASNRGFIRIDWSDGWTGGYAPDELSQCELDRDHAPYGEMCRDPWLCHGKGYCPRDPTCGD